MKLWHDDMRTPPDDTWTVARTNAEAINLLARGDVSEASLDYQLAWGEDGLELAKAMAEAALVPPKVTCHSLSPMGAEQMAEVLRAAGCPDVQVKAALW